MYRRILFSMLLCAAQVSAHADERYAPRFARTELPAMVMYETCGGKPAWPRSSLRNEETGVVVLRYMVAPNGAVLEVKVESSSGFRELDNATIVGYSQCKFRPASIEGKPVTAFAYIKYIWTLE